jgi:hypothetical protein
MWRRYLIGNLNFAAIVARQRLRRALLEAFFRFLRDGRFAAELSEPKFAAGLRQFVFSDAGRFQGSTLPTRRNTETTPPMSAVSEVT